jgi:hypothetical protein
MGPIEHRCPEYLRGLIVGRLGHSQSELASRVRGVSDRHMAAVHDALIARRRRLGGTRPPPPVATDEHLSDDDFNEVYCCASEEPLADRRPEFLRGFIVGRLADGLPDVAWIAEGMSTCDMAALYYQVMHVIPTEPAG